MRGSEQRSCVCVLMERKTMLLTRKRPWKEENKNKTIQKKKKKKKGKQCRRRRRRNSLVMQRQNRGRCNTNPSHWHLMETSLASG